ncbi:MAG TPA: hypothetical protein DDY91_22325 [Planctomycetaceae bacterium]|nr:hypothetical protein [Planctomycetaceae bacterium]
MAIEVTRELSLQNMTSAGPTHVGPTPGDSRALSPRIDTLAGGTIAILRRMPARIARFVELAQPVLSWGSAQILRGPL